MNYKKIILSILSIIGILITDKYYVDNIAFSWLLITFLVIHLFLLFRNAKNLSFSFVKLLFSLLIACFWLYSTYQGLGHLENRYIRYLVVLVAAITYTFSFYLLISELENPFKAKRNSRSKWWIVVYLVLPIFNWTRYFLAYYPGKMTFDSFWQWSMAHGIKQYNAWHPILHTLWIQLTSEIYNSPASYIISQIIVIAVIVGYALYVLQTFGVPKWILILVSAAYAFYPVNGYYVVTMWKDIPFAAFILLMTVFFAQIVLSNGQWLNRKINVGLFVVVCFITMNLRNNGFLALFITLLLFILIMKGMRKKATILTAVIVCIHFIFNYPIMSYMHVIKNPLNQALAIPSQQIAATYYHNGKFPAETKEYFNRILPEANWKKDYNPYTVDPIKHDEMYDASVIEGSFSTYLVNWAKLLRYNFGTYVNAYLDQVSVIWQFHSPKDYKVYIGTVADLDDYSVSLKMMASEASLNNEEQLTHLNEITRNAYNAYKNEVKTNFPDQKVVSFKEFKKLVTKSMAPLKTESKQEKLKEKFDKQFKTLQEEWQNYYAKGAIYFFLLLVSLVASIRRFKLKGIIVFAPAVFVLLTIAVAMPATDFRYSYSFVISTPFLLFFAKLKESVHLRDENNEE